MAFLAALLSAPVLAQPLTTNDAVTRLFEQEIEAGWFGDAFLAQVPIEQIVRIIRSLEEQFGALVAVEGEGGQLTTRLESATMPTQITLDSEGRIVGLFFGAPVPLGDDVDPFVADIMALPGTISVLVLTDGEVVAAHQPDLPLGVGSAFKLAVLAALIDDIESGVRAWSDVVTLDAATRSLPSGILQTWPPGTPVTLATLANLMISLSDNTATDTLIAVLGRERIEMLTPRNAPFLTTGDLFRLKSDGGGGLTADWIAGDEAERRLLLEDIATGPLPAVDELLTEPILEIEWFFTAHELCALLERVGGNPAMSINPGVADPRDWAHVAYKGGSEAGVLNFSTLVTADDGTTHCVVATWNNEEPVDEGALIPLYAGILGVLAGD